MAITHGADVGDLAALARRFDEAADDLQRSGGKVSGAIQTAAWQGPAASRFRAEWHQRGESDLSRAQRLLRDQAGNLRRQVADQNRASRPIGAATACTWSESRDRTGDMAGAAKKSLSFAKFAGGVVKTIVSVGDKTWGTAKSGSAAFGPVMKVFGFVGSAFGLVDGVREELAGHKEGNVHRSADGIISQTVGMLGMYAVVCPPLVIPAGIIGGFWGGLKLLSGNVPVTKRIDDFGHTVGEWMTDKFGSPFDVPKKVLRVTTSLPFNIVKSVIGGGFKLPWQK